MKWLGGLAGMLFGYSVGRFENAMGWMLGGFLAGFFGGNTVLKAGIIILFFGVAFLVKYAADSGVLPIELRLAGVAAGGIALLVAGFRLRNRADHKAAYGLALQAGHLPRHLVFVARGAEPFVIAYGKRSRAGEKAMPVAAALPLGSLMPDYRPGVEWSLPAVRAGAAVTHNPAAVESGFTDRVEPRKLVLWAMLLGAVLVLALMAWRLAGRINKGG